MNSIPASEFVLIIPGVLAAGESPQSMNGLALDQDPSLPIGTVVSFASLGAVERWFGFDSLQAQFAAKYFAGFTGCTQLPSALLMAQYNESAVGAYIRSGSVAALSLAQLQALSGDIVIAIDGRTVTSANINLSSATSFSNAAQLIQAGLQSTGSIFSGTGSITSNLLDITVVASGELHIGDVIAGVGVTGGCTIQSFGNGTGGTGTYHVSTTADVGSEALSVTSTATCTYSSLLAGFVISSSTTGPASTIAFPTDNSLSPMLNFQQAQGAVLSQGAAAATPASAMGAVTLATQNFASFSTTWEPDLDTKLAFATWNTAQGPLYAYVGWDSDVTPTQENSDPNSFGAQVATDTGVIAIWNPSGMVAFAVMGWIASIDFTAPNGRTTLAYRKQAGLTPDVGDQTAYENLKANGYNAYCNIATRTAQFQNFQPGQISGDWDWADSYANQIYWNSRFQNDLMNFLEVLKAVPYNPRGFTSIREALASAIADMGSFGAWVPNVELSSTQALAVNTAANATIAPTIESQGWYLQVDDPGPTVRQERGSPICNFWYTDGESVQVINMASVDIQ